MRISILKKSLAVIGLLFVILFSVYAQQPGSAARQGAAVAGDKADYIRVRKFTGVGRQILVKTPVYSTNAARSATREQEWAQIWVQYDTAPAWIDEIVFQYHVLAKRVEDRKELFSLYRKTVRYIDIPQGRGRMSTVFLRPNTLKRYGEVVAAAVEISIDGKLVDVQTEASMQVPPEWWKNPLVTESPAVTIKDGYLLDRSETPFALINIDDHEVIK